jgi:hypothetical protein
MMKITRTEGFLGNDDLVLIVTEQEGEATLYAVFDRSVSGQFCPVYTSAGEAAAATIRKTATQGAAADHRVTLIPGRDLRELENF